MHAKAGDGWLHESKCRSGVPVHFIVRPNFEEVGFHSAGTGTVGESDEEGKRIESETHHFVRP